VFARAFSYLGTKKEIDRDMIYLTNDIIDAIGFNEPVSIQVRLQLRQFSMVFLTNNPCAAMQTVLASSMGALYFVRLFLDQIFTFSTVVLVREGPLHFVLVGIYAVFVELERNARIQFETGWFGGVADLQLTVIERRRKGSDLVFVINCDLIARQ
jgi:hypothetical protein